MQRTRKKKILVMVAVFVAVLGGLVLFAIYNVDSIAQRYKPVIEQVASEALGSEVSIGTIGATVIPSTRITLTQVRIAVPDIEEEAISLDGAALHVKLLPLLQGNIDASALTLNVPKLTFLKDEDGIRLSGLPKEKPEPEEETEEAPEEEMMTMNVEIERIFIKKGRIVLRDTVNDTRQVIDPVNLEAGIALENTGIRLSDINGDARLLEVIDVALTGGGVAYQFDNGVTSINKVETKLPGGTIVLDGGLRPGDPEQRLKVTSGGVELKGLTPLWDVFAPTLNEYDLKGKATPDLEVALTESGYTVTGAVNLSEGAAVVSNVNVSDLVATATLDFNESRQRFSSDNITLSLNEIPVRGMANGALENGKLTLSDYNISAFSGELKGKAGMMLGDTTSYNADASASGLSIEEMAKALFPTVPLKLTGTVKTVSAKVDGALTDEPLITLNGDGALELAEGILKDINLAKQIMAAVQDIPFISGSLLDIAPPAIKAQLDRDYTVLDSVTGTVELLDGKLNSNDLHVDGNLFVLDAQGWLGLDTAIDLRTQFALNKEMSTALATSVKELERLFDPQGRLAFPVRITGTASEPKIRPDLEKLLKDTVRTQVERGAERLLEGLMGGGSSEASEGEGEGEGEVEENNNPLGGLFNQLRR